MGGTGFDEVSYLNASGGVTIDIDTPANNTGDAAGDTFDSIERLRLTDFADIFVGSSLVMAQNNASGMGGDDTFISGGVGTRNPFFGGDGEGNDYANGGNDMDTVNGGASNDFITGGMGNDSLYGGTGADTFIFNSTDTGRDYIYDFETDVDVLQFNGLTMADVTVSTSGNGHALITIDSSGATIELRGISEVDIIDDMSFV